MRKNSIRKLVHGILDLLPLFVIPIFAININQKSVEPISIEVQEQISVDFNQKIINGNFENTQNWTAGNCTISTNQNVIEIVPNNNVQFPQITQSFKVERYHYYMVQVTYLAQNGLGLNVNGAGGVNNFPSSTTFTTGYYKLYANLNSNNLFIIYSFNSSTTYYLSNLMIFDLTQMDLENITANEFSNYFNATYYPTIESEKLLINKPTLTTYDDTDIGSQFLYSLYISTDKYFNMNQVFNLNSVYQWFELNIFGGSAPLSIYIVWNIIIYELVMDLLMLLYALFMFFIDMCQKLIDKPLNSIK